MTRSMTGFGRGEEPLASGRVSVEVRTVNSRHLDVRVRLPREFGALEPAVRACARRFFARGQVEVQVRLPLELAGEPEVALNQPVVRHYLEAADSLTKDFDLEGGLSVETLLGLPGVIRTQELSAATEALEPTVLNAVERACEEAAAMRAREGEALARDVRARVERLEGLLGDVEARAATVEGGLRERLRRRVQQLAPELELDPARLDQEVVFYADRMDVTEETVRSRSHLSQLLAALDGGGAVGRRLEFLLQELGREVNTIGSKAGDAPIASLVVEIKTEIEKIREQVLNVE